MNQLLVAKWISSSFPVIRTIIMFLLAFFALALIVLVFMQIGTGSETNNVITGNTGSYYAQNKGSSKQGRITKLVYICLGVIAVLCIIYFILLKVYRG